VLFVGYLQWNCSSFVKATKDKTIHVKPKPAIQKGPATLGTQRLCPFKKPITSIYGQNTLRIGEIPNSYGDTKHIRAVVKYSDTDTDFAEEIQDVATVAHSIQQERSARRRIYHGDEKFVTFTYACKLTGAYIPRRTRDLF
jgi:hypothetical protein